MKRLLIAILVLVARVTWAQTPEVVSGEEWVVSRPDGAAIQTKDISLLKAFAVHGVAVTRTFERRIGVHADSGAAELLRSQGFLVEPNYLFHQDAAATAPWQLARISQRNPWQRGRVAGLLPPTSGTAYVLDTFAYDGTQTGEEFGSRLVRGPDFVGGNDSALGCRVHGSIVSSILAGTSSGVNPEAKIVSLRVSDCTGTISYLAATAAFDWVLAHSTQYGVGVINLSWGGYAGNRNPYANQFKKLRSKGFVLVASAGNAGVDAKGHFPCNGADLCVGATNQADQRATFSNWGKAVHVFAPGDDIATVGPDGNLWMSGGTSAAAPQVSGTWLLLRGRFPALTPTRISLLLLANATKGTVGNAGAGSPNRVLHAGGVVETAPASFFRYATSQKRLSARIQLMLNGEVSLSQWASFFAGPRGADGRCQGQAFASRVPVGRTGEANASQTGLGAAPANVVVLP
jgi:hypothetical protein